MMMNQFGKDAIAPSPSTLPGTRSITSPTSEPTQSRDLEIDFESLKAALSPALIARIRALAAAHSVALTTGLPTPATTQAMAAIWSAIEAELEAKIASDNAAKKSAPSGDVSFLLAMPQARRGAAIAAIEKAAAAERSGDKDRIRVAKGELEKIAVEQRTEQNSESVHGLFKKLLGIPTSGASMFRP